MIKITKPMCIDLTSSSNFRVSAFEKLWNRHTIMVLNALVSIKFSKMQCLSMNTQNRMACNTHSPIVISTMMCSSSFTESSIKYYISMRNVSEFKYTCFNDDSNHKVIICYFPSNNIQYKIFIYVQQHLK